MFLIHVVGICVLFGTLLRSDGGGGWRSWWPHDDGGGGGGSGPGPESRPPGPPLADAEPSAARLREPGRIADAQPRPSRRPQHAPERVPQRERA